MRFSGLQTYLWKAPKKKNSGQVLSKMLSKDFIIIKYHHQAKFYKVKDNFNIFFPVEQQ